MTNRMVPSAFTCGYRKCLKSRPESRIRHSGSRPTAHMSRCLSICRCSRCEMSSRRAPWNAV